MNNILEENKELIERFVSLVTCNDYNIDSKHRWFYSVLSEIDISALNISAEDIRQDIILFILEQHANYKGKNFSSFLNLSLSWFVRDKIIYLWKQQTTIDNIIYPTSYTMDIYNSVDLSWVLAQDNIPLTEYERYILYLDLYKCYTINEICGTVYQDRSTVRKSLNIAKQILLQEFT